MSDAYWDQVSALLHCNGSNGSTSFVDSSSNGHTVTAAGNAQISTAQSKFGGASALFDGVGDYLTIASHADFAMGSGDFTWEAQVYVTGGSDYRQIFSTRASNGSSSSAGSLAINPSGGLTWYTSGFIVNYTTSIGTNQWVHVAVSRTGTTLRVFADGVQVGSATNSDNLTAQVFSVGANNDGSEPFTGYIDEVRVTKGVGRYTGAFTPPTAEFPEFSSIDGLVEAAGPLGAASALAALMVSGLGSDAGPLGQPAVFGIGKVDGLASDSGPLGQPSVQVALAYGFAAGPSPLGEPLPFGIVYIVGLAEVASPLRAASVNAFSDFTGQLAANQPTRYVMDLVTPGGLVRMPISSWQATLRSGAGSGYAQCVVPAVEGLVTALQTATEFIVSRTGALTTGGLIEYEMVRSPLEQLTLDRGPTRHTATLAGYFDALSGDEPTSENQNRQLVDVRSLSITEGGTRARCAIDWLLRPGHTAIYEDLEIAVTFINYYGNTDDQYMDVGSYAG